MFERDLKRDRSVNSRDLYEHNCDRDLVRSDQGYVSRVYSQGVFVGKRGWRLYGYEWFRYAVRKLAAGCCEIIFLDKVRNEKSHVAKLLLVRVAKKNRINDRAKHR